MSIMIILNHPVGYFAPDCCVCENVCGEAMLADSYYSGGGGSFGEDDIVDNGNY